MSTMQTPVIHDFGGRLSREFPSQLVIDITEVCNLACIHCPHPNFVKSPHYGKRFLEPELNARAVDEVREHGIGHTGYIRYSSEGEPLMHPQAYPMIEYAVRHSGVFVTLTTNGTTMNERRMRRLLDAGVHMIDISIDAHLPETYARIRVNGELELTRGNVLRLLDWIHRDRLPTRVVVSFVEQSANQGEAEDFRQFWQNAGAHQVVVRRLHSAAGAVVHVARDMQAALQVKPRTPCLYPWERMVLNPRGWLAFCPADWSHGSSIADYRHCSIREIWQGAFYQRLRAAHLDNDFSGHAFCGQCPDWSQTRWPGEGQSYADLVDTLRPQP